MKQFIDKSLLIILCCFFSSNSPVTVIAVLTVVSVSSVCQYSGKGRVSLAAEIVYIVLCFMIPEFAYMLPAVIYDFMSERRYAAAVAAGITIAAGFSTGDIINVSAVIVLCGLSLWLQSKTCSMEELQHKYIVSRDNSAELNMLLKENNFRLRENQDYEVRLATLKERNRIAREIHDNVGHLLSRSILQVGALQVVEDEDFRREGLAGLNETLSSAMDSIRQSVHDLHDDSTDLRMAVKEAVKPLAVKGLDIRLECDFSESIPNKIKLCLISVVKEAVSNIIKHSDADKITFILREHPGLYQLVIEDNGCCSEKISENGIGLSNMRERIQELGGIIRFTSGKQGFKIFISIQKRIGEI